MAVPTSTNTNAILQSVLESTDDMIGAFDAKDLTLLASNSAAKQHFRKWHDRDFRTGATVDELFGPERAPFWRSCLMRAIREGAFSVEREGEVEGQVFWLTFDRLVNAGTCFGVSVISRDITSIRRTAQALTRAEALLTRLFQASPSALVLTKLDSAVMLDVNDAFCALTGYAPSDLVGRTTIDLEMWRDLTEREHLMAILRAEGRVHGFEVRFRHRDGRILSCLLDCNIVEVDDSPCVITSMADVTAIRAAETALAVSNLRFRTLIESAPDGILVIDAGAKRCIEANENACRIFGCQRAELLEAPLSLFIPPSQLDGTSSLQTGESRLDSAMSGVPQTFDCLVRGADGRHIECEVRMTRLPDETRTLVRASVLDISERKRLERETSALRTQLEQAARLESLGTLAGGIAHDFNNILGAMIGFIDLALMRTDDGPMKPLLEDIEAAALRAVDLVRQILAFSRHSPVEKKSVQVASVAREAVRLVRAGLPATVTVHESYATSACVLADPTQVHQIVMNLCTNARTAMSRSGGRLCVTVDEQEASSALLAGNPGLRPGSYVHLAVTDTGAGISPEIQQRIFEPFFTTRSQGEGTGLGLSVVHGIVKNIGGTIQVTSELGKGSTFEVFLPICAQQQSPLATAPVPVRGNGRVLLVDDDRALLEATCASLTDLGYVVSAFHNPIEALNAFRIRPHTFDVLVTDMTMPRLTGDALGAAVRELRPDLPMILVSGFSDLVTPEQVCANGFAAFLAKPLRPAALAQAIEQIRAHRKGLHPRN